MPYLEPEHVLKRFSKFALAEVRPAIDDEFLQGQVGSMASTLRFVSMEVAGWPDAIERQHDALLTALDEVAATVEDDAVGATVADAIDRVSEAPAATDDPDDLERTLLAASNDVLDAIEEELAGDAARRARGPVYEFLEVRVQSQLELMGRERR